MDLNKLYQEAKDPSLVPDGNHDVEVTFAEVSKSKTNPERNVLRLTYRVTSDVDDVDGPLSSIREHYPIPMDSDEYNSSLSMMARAKRALTALGHDGDFPETTEQAAALMGLEGHSVRVITETSDNYPDQNKLIWPKLDSELEAAPKRGRAKA